MQSIANRRNAFLIKIQNPGANNILRSSAEDISRWPALQKYSFPNSADFQRLSFRLSQGICMQKPLQELECCKRHFVSEQISSFVVIYCSLSKAEQLYLLFCLQ